MLCTWCLFNNVDKQQQNHGYSQLKIIIRDRTSRPGIHEFVCVTAANVEERLKSRSLELGVFSFLRLHTHSSLLTIRCSSLFQSQVPTRWENMTNSHKTDSWKSVHSSAEFTDLQTFCIRFNISNENWFNSGKLKRKRGFTKQTKLVIERKRDRDVLNANKN